MTDYSEALREALSVEMSSVVIRKDPKMNAFDREPLEILAKEGAVDLKIMEGTLEKVERIVISKPVEDLRNWCSYMNLFASFLILLMAFSISNIIYNPHRLDRLTEVQKSWHYNGNPFQTGVVSKRGSKFNTGSYDDPLISDVEQIISSNIEWFDSYFKDDEVQMISSETKLANYKQKLVEILRSKGLENLGNLEEYPHLRREVDESDKSIARLVAKILERLEFSLIFLFISLTIAFAVAMRIYCGAMYFASLRLNQQKNIRKLLEIENDQFYIAKGLYWVCNSSNSHIMILRANKNLVPTGEKCHLYKLTHSCEQEYQKPPNLWWEQVFSKFPSKVSSVFNPKPHQHPPCQCQGCYHQQPCQRPHMSRMGWYSPEQEYMMHGGMGPPGMMPPGQFMAPSVHQNFMNVYSTNIVTPNLPGLRNRRTAEQYLDPTGGEWYVQDDEVMSDPGTRSFLDTENTSDKETVKKRGSQAGSRYYPQRRADSGTASIKLGAPWLSPRGKKKTQKAFRSNVSSKQ